MDRVSDPTILGKGAADASGVVRQVAVHRISALSVAGEWLGRERALEIGAASQDAALRWKAAWGLSVGGRRRALFLTKLLQDVDEGVRREAARSLGPGGTTDQAGTPAETAGKLTDPDPGHVLEALDALRRSGLATAEAVGPVLQHKDQAVRLGAAEALAGSSVPEAHLLLRPLIGDRDERIRAAVVSVLPQLLADKEPSVLVLRAAARTGKVPRLARHPDLLVRWAMPGADADGAAYGRGTIAREDALRHARFSWNAPRDRPAEYSTLRPPVVRPYGRSSRG
jgi:HEAT repeat protein